MTPIFTKRSNQVNSIYGNGPILFSTGLYALLPGAWVNANSASKPFLINVFDHEANVDSLVLQQVHHQLTQILMALQVHSHLGSLTKFF